MTAFTDGLTATALRLLTKYGEAVSLSKTVEGSYNTANGTVGAGTTTTYTGYGAPTSYDKTEVDGEIIKATDIRLILNKTSTVPEQGDTCVLNGTTYRVLDVKHTRASGVDIVYILQLRV